MEFDQLMQHMESLGKRIDRAVEQRRMLKDIAKATLLFHSGSPWSAAKSEEWKQLTGRDEATTRQLCDFIREQLELVE